MRYPTGGFSTVSSTSGLYYVLAGAPLTSGAPLSRSRPVLHSLTYTDKCPPHTWAVATDTYQVTAQLPRSLVSSGGNNTTRRSETLSVEGSNPACGRTKSLLRGDMSATTCRREQQPSTKGRPGRSWGFQAKEERTTARGTSPQAPVSQSRGRAQQGAWGLEPRFRRGRT